MLWIALVLPELPLQLALRGKPQADTPLVVAEGPATRPVVCCANSTALQRGVQPGMPVVAARALAGELEVLQRDTAAEAQALHNLACWAGQFTPSVSLQAQGLLLEVDSTLRLHRGLRALLLQLRQGLAALGYRAVPAVAPTPLAAWWLACARQAGLALRSCRTQAQLPEHLAALPLALLDWPQRELHTLHTLGVRTLGQCLALPRDGFIRRFGAALRLQLDRALGLAPDPRQWFTPPASFRSRLEFGFELNDAQMLLFPLKRLLHELEGFLRSRGAGVQHWQLLLSHWNRGHTRIAVGTATPERSAERLLLLARERLARLTLDAPVLQLELLAENLLPFDESNQSLVPDARSRSIGWSQLVDRLSARLGGERIGGLQALDDHRPERAWRRRGATTLARLRTGKSSAVAAEAGKPALTVLKAGAAQRPLWLLEPPRALSSREGRPLCQGQLDLLAGPERIEAGWWDGQPACRDYYVARNAKGETLWIYREHRREAHWYLHGIFG